MPRPWSDEDGPPKPERCISVREFNARKRLLKKFRKQALVEKPLAEEYALLSRSELKVAIDSLPPTRGWKVALLLGHMPRPEDCV